MRNGSGVQAKKTKKKKAAKDSIPHIAVGREHHLGMLQQKFHASIAAIEWWTALFNSPHGVLDVSEVTKHADPALVGKQANVQRLLDPSRGAILVSVVDRLDGPIFPRYNRSFILLEPQGKRNSAVFHSHGLRACEAKDGDLLPVVEVSVGFTGPDLPAAVPLVERKHADAAQEHEPMPARGLRPSADPVMPPAQQDGACRAYLLSPAVPC
jgi:hypothetical protein